MINSVVAQVIILFIPSHHYSYPDGIPVYSVSALLKTISTSNFGALAMPTHQFCVKTRVVQLIEEEIKITEIHTAHAFVLFKHFQTEKIKTPSRETESLVWLSRYSKYDKTAPFWGWLEQFELLCLLDTIKLWTNFLFLLHEPSIENKTLMHSCFIRIFKPKISSQYRVG